MITLAVQQLAMHALDALATAVSTSAGAAAPGGPTTSGGPPPPQWFAVLAQWGPIILLVLVFWFVMNGSKKRQERDRASLLDNLKKGDKVKLIGGEYGAVVETRDGRVLVKVDEGSNTKIWYDRQAIASVEKDATAAKEDK